MRGLKQARKDRAYSQRDLAALMNVTPQTISNWECGQRKPSMCEMSKLTKVLKCDYNMLIGGKR